MTDRTLAILRDCLCYRVRILASDPSVTEANVGKRINAACVCSHAIEAWRILRDVPVRQ